MLFPANYTQHYNLHLVLLVAWCMQFGMYSVIHHGGWTLTTQLAETAAVRSTAIVYI
jgi:hypothetical protein